MAAEAVKEDVAQRDTSDCPGVEPKKHPNVVCGPKIINDPSDKSLVQQRFVENVDNVSRKESPKENIQKWHTHNSSN